MMYAISHEFVTRRRLIDFSFRLLNDAPFFFFLLLDWRDEVPAKAVGSSSLLSRSQPKGKR